MTAGLPIVTRPRWDENALSFVSRLAEANRIPLRHMMASIGRLRAVDRLTESQWAELAILAGVSSAELAPLRRSKAGLPSCPSAVRFLGHSIKPSYLTRSVTRICPQCIAVSPMILSIWELHYVPVCLHHKTLLVQHCECGRSLHTFARGANNWSCVCGRSFANLTSAPASERVETAANWIISHFHGPGQPSADASISEIGAPFAGLHVADLMGAIDFLGRAATTPAHKDEPKRVGGGYGNGGLREHAEVEAAVRYIEAAVPILQNWPSAYHELLGQVAGRNPAPTRPRGTNYTSGARAASMLFSTRIGRMLLYPYRGIDGQPMSCFTDEISEYCRRTHNIRFRKQVLSRTSSTARAVRFGSNMTRVAKHVGGDPKSRYFSRIYEDVVQSFDDRKTSNARELNLLVLHEVERRWAEHNSLLSGHAASSLLDNGNYPSAIRSWIHPELLQPVCDGAARQHTHRVHGSYRLSDVEELRRRLSKATKIIPVGAIPPGYVLYNEGGKPLYGAGGGYTKTAFILDVLSGRIPTVTEVERPRLSDLYIDERVSSEVSWEARMLMIAQKDYFWHFHRIRILLASLWLSVPHESQQVLKQLRLTGELRFEEYRNTTSGRDRPGYRYSVVDSLLRQFGIAGPSRSRTANQILAKLAKREIVRT